MPLVAVSEKIARRSGITVTRALSGASGISVAGSSPASPIKYASYATHAYGTDERKGYEMLIEIVTRCAKCGNLLNQNLSGAAQGSGTPAGNAQVQVMVSPDCPGCEAAKKCRRNVPPAGATIEVSNTKNSHKYKHKILYCAGKRGSFFDGRSRIKASPDFCTALEGCGTEYTYWRLPSEDKWSN